MVFSPHLSYMKRFNNIAGGPASQELGFKGLRSGHPWQCARFSASIDMYQRELHSIEWPLMTSATNFLANESPSSPVA